MPLSLLFFWFPPKQRHFSERMWECVNTEFDWEVKRGIEKSAGRYSCPLTRESVKRKVHCPWNAFINVFLESAFFEAYGKPKSGIRSPEMESGTGQKGT